MTPEEPGTQIHYLKDFSQILLPDPIMAPEETGTQIHSPAGTDLRT